MSLFERVLVVRLTVVVRSVTCKETVAPLIDTIFDRRTELVRLKLILGSLYRDQQRLEMVFVRPLSVLLLLT